jgi:beta-galactosidase
MKHIGKIAWLLFMLLPMSLLVNAQPASSFFPKEKLMQVGVYYYPEHWPETQWARDLNTMKELGFEFTHVGEFAWAFMEPEEGKFDFSWLDRFLDLAGKAGIKVILCTPTPCPPAWMAQKYPEIFLWDAGYRPLEHGSRGNNALSDSVYLKFCDRIVSELGGRYGRDPRVWGWQLDNEPGAPQDFSPSAQENFRRWLEKKYKTAAGLNSAWGARFWSLKYGNFDEIRIPNTARLYGVNPSAVLDFKRFTADQTGGFLNRQSDTLRKYIDRTQWITTNYISSISSADPRRSDRLDFISYTMYPVGGGRNLGENGFRLGWPQGIAFANSFYRPFRGVTGVMELQPGQVNWARINPQPEPGVVRMWLWHAFAGGCSFACTYRFRQPLFGSEQYHAGIIGTDGVTPSRGGMEYSRVISEIQTLRTRYNPKAVPPSDYARRKTAILWNHENLWNLETQPQTSQWSTWDHMFKYLMIGKSFGAPVDFISESDSFDQYPVVIAPAYQLLDLGLVLKWMNYAANGGHLVLTCRTGQKNRDGVLWEAKWAAPIVPLIGAEIEGFDLMLEDGKGIVRSEGGTFGWNNWGDILNPFGDTESLGVYGNDFYAGKSAAVTRKHGKGTVTYIGVDTDDGSFEKEAMKRVYADAGIPVKDYPAGVFAEWRDGFWVAVNYSSDDYKLDLPSDAKLLIGDAVLSPADVAVWTISP